MTAAENVHPLFTPNAEAMREHLEHLFGGYLDGYHDGLIELAWTDTKPNADGRYALSHATMFGTDQIDELVAEACRLNSQPMRNVYVGAALRKPGTFPGGRAKAEDVLALTCAYADLDDDGAAVVAKDKYGAAKPTKIVVTGREPYTRAQMWWRLDEPMTDQKASEALLKGMAVALGGDPSVTDPPRVMRLAGTIAWPMKPDRKRPELTFIAPLREPGQPVYAATHLARLFPPAQGDAFDAGGIQFPQDGVTRSANVFGMGDKVEDGRERYMVKTINACLIQLVGEAGRTPGAQELFDAAWPQYARNTDFSRPGRGQREFGRKVVYTLKRFAEGRIRGCETIEKVQTLYRQRQQAHTSSGGQGKYHDYTGSDEFSKGPQIDPETGEPLPLILTAEQFLKGFNPPAYLVDGIMQRGYLYSLTARTGHGKTAIALYIAQTVARLRQDMHGREVKHGTVLILAGENPDDIRARFLVLADYWGFDASSVKIRFVAGVINIPGRLAEIRADVADIDDLVLVIVDTAAAYFPGDETNSNSQQGAYARLLRELTFLPGKPAVLVCCHPIKNAARDNLLPMGGSAFLNEVDGNLTLWSNAEKQITLHWLGKFRGPEFEPLAFELDVADSAKVVDAEGRLMPSVVAKPVSELSLQMAEGRQESDENMVLQLIADDRKISLSTIATKCGFLDGNGNPMKSKVFRICTGLVDEKLLERRGNKYRITAKGKKELGEEPGVFGI